MPNYSDANIANGANGGFADGINGAGQIVNYAAATCCAPQPAPLPAVRAALRALKKQAGAEPTGSEDFRRIHVGAKDLQHVRANSRLVQ